MARYPGETSNYASGASMGVDPGTDEYGNPINSSAKGRRRLLGDEQLVDTKYRDMSPAYRERFSRKEYRERRDEQRMAGDAIGTSKKGLDRYKEDNFGVKDLDDFNRRASGAGGSAGKGYKAATEDASAKFGRGADRLSKLDIQNLLENSDNWMGSGDGKLPDDLQAKQELINYANASIEDGAKVGGKAQALLQRYTDEIAKYIPDETGGDGSSGGSGGGSGGSGGSSEKGGGSDASPPASDNTQSEDRKSDIVNDVITSTPPGTEDSGQVIVNDIDNEILNTLTQTATAENNFGDITYEKGSFSGNTLKGGSSININNAQTAGDNIATNRGSQDGTIKNNIDNNQVAFNPNTGGYEIVLGGGEDERQRMLRLMMVG